MKATSGVSAPYRVGEWLPSDHTHLENWLEAIIHKTRMEERALHPVIADFQDLIESDAEIFMLFNQMFEQVPRKPTGKSQVRTYRHMLHLLNTIMTHAPEFNQSGLVGCPINTIFDWSMGTAAGFAAFLNERVNAQLKPVLNSWGRFLSSSESTYVLSQDAHKGWFGADALKAMPNFDQEFKCDPSQSHRGFKSWDDYFTREFRPGVRPVALPDGNQIISSALRTDSLRAVGRPLNGGYFGTVADRSWPTPVGYRLTSYARSSVTIFRESTAVSDPIG